jgi:hypothetical protein
MSSNAKYEMKKQYKAIKTEGKIETIVKINQKSIQYLGKRLNKSPKLI